MARQAEYKPSFKYEDVWTGRKYSPEPPTRLMLQTCVQPRAPPPQRPPVMLRNLDLNSGPTTSLVVEEHHDLPEGSYRRSSRETMATVAKVVQRRRLYTKIKHGSRRLLHDRTSSGYGWLPPGWLGEERIMETGRVYRYYCDPDGRFYYSRFEALTAMASLRNNSILYSLSLAPTL